MKHGFFYQSPEGHLAGNGCPKCMHTYTKPHKRVVQYLESLGYKEKEDFLINGRKTLRNPSTGCFLELDIYFIKQGKAIEVDGLYYHTSTDVIARDKIKDQLCLNLNIRLLRITDKQINKDWGSVEESVHNLMHL